MSFKQFYFGLFFLISFASNAQTNTKEVLFTVNEKPYYTDEFSRIYKKNLDLVKDDSQKDLENSCKALDVLFQNYLFLSQSNAILTVVPNMEYNHIVHDGSYYMETCNQLDMKKFNILFK